MNLRFYIEKDGETVWSNKTIALTSKTKSKNVMKSLQGPKDQACHYKTQL